MQYESLEKIIKKTGKTFGLQQEILNREKDHEEKFEDSWEGSRDEWIPYLKTDFFSLVFIYARYTWTISKITSFGMKDSFLPLL